VSTQPVSSPQGQAAGLSGPDGSRVSPSPQAITLKDAAMQFRRLAARVNPTAGWTGCRNFTPPRPNQSAAHVDDFSTAVLIKS
jgi:hypothetical protein